MTVAEAGAAVKRDIKEVHGFFVEWFNGSCPNTDTEFDSRLTARLAPEFRIVMPGGMTLAGVQLLERLRSGYGSNPEFRIELRDVCVLAVPESDRTYLAIYEEWQKAARNSEPRDNGRVTSAVFIANDDSPNGVVWFHAHETWLPQTRIAAERFNF